MIERHRTSLICLHDGKVLGFNAEDPTSGKPYFFLPGGKIESGESAEEATLRETLEETGFTAVILPGFRVEEEYVFHWDGQDYFSKTVFLAGRLKDATAKPADVEDASYHRGRDWIPVEDIPRVFAYHSKITAAVTAGVLFLQLQENQRSFSRS